MKKLCFLLALLLLLSGCAAPAVDMQPSQVTEPAQTGWVDLDIYAVNDLHGRLLDSATQPGVEELTTYLKQAQQTGNTVLLSTGDMWQGTSESNLTGGMLVTEWMNEVRFDAMTLGGHEYDWGEEQIRKNDQIAAFPILGINVYSRSTDQRVDYCQSSLLLDREGVQIGIIGAIGNCYYSIAPEHTEDVYFKTGQELTALVKSEAEKLRTEGADFIIYAIHDGFDQTSTTAMAVSDSQISGYYDTALSDGFVDLVFEADTHYSYILTDRHGVYHLQGGANNTGISHVRVLFDKARGDIYVATAEILPASKYSHFEKDPVVETLLEKYADEIGAVNEILGVNGRYRNNYMLSRLVAKLYRDKGVEIWGADYDIILGGGYISCRSPGYLPEGEVTYSQLQSLLPFDNRITLCSMQGRDLISRFLENDHEAYHIQMTPYGEQIRNQIEPDGIYYVVTDSYSADYSYNRMTVVDTYDADIFARDLLAAYIAAGQMD